MDRIERLDSVQTFRANEASEAALYANDGVSLRTIREARRRNPKYMRGLIAVQRFYNEICEGSARCMNYGK
ncbi:MAG TPA: hypothetical protein VKV17_11295 [Bryobacteraceae bacterium]|nr:hypothetical protein [Bryobacteraceae bacterium]